MAEAAFPFISYSVILNEHMINFMYLCKLLRMMLQMLLISFSPVYPTSALLDLELQEQRIGMEYVSF